MKLGYHIATLEQCVTTHLHVCFSSMHKEGTRKREIIQLSDFACQSKNFPIMRPMMIAAIRYTAGGKVRALAADVSGGPEGVDMTVSVIATLRRRTPSS